MIGNLIKKIVGSKNERELKRIQPLIQRINQVESKVSPPPPAGSPAASAPAPAPAAQAAPGVAPPADAGPKPLEDNYLLEGEALYRHQNERDPFIPLVLGTGRAGGQGAVKKRPCPPGQTGLCKYSVEECNLEAILRTPDGVMAWFQGPDTKAYKIVTGERFADGVVLDINYDSGEITIQQELETTDVKPFRNLVLKIRKQEGEGQ